MTSVLASLQIQFLSFVYSHVARRLNDFENYRTETAYENNLIFKTFLFQVCGFVFVRILPSTRKICL